MAIRKIREGVTTWPIDEVIRQLDSPDTGLCSEEVKSRTEKHPYLPRPDFQWRWFTLFLNPHSLLLLATLGLLSLSGFSGPVAFVSGFWILGLGVSGWAEWQRYRLARSLTPSSHPSVRVRRDGVVIEVPSNTLVRGDRLPLRSGEKVPADCRLIATEGLMTREDSLTGEGRLVRKNSDPLPHGEYPLAEQANMVFAGTFILRGQGEGVVVDTTPHTQMDQLLKWNPVKEPLLQGEMGFTQLMRRLSLVVLASLAVWVFAGWFQGGRASQWIVLGLAVAAATIPTGLVSLVLLAVHRLGQKFELAGVGLRDLEAVDRLASVSCIVCEDEVGVFSSGDWELAHWAQSGSRGWGVDSPPGEAFALSACVAASGDYRDAYAFALATACEKAALSWGWEPSSWRTHLPRVGGQEGPGETWTTVHRVSHTDALGKSPYIAVSRGEWVAIRERCRTLWSEATGAGVLPMGEIDELANRWMREGLRVVALTFKELPDLKSPEQWQERHHLLGLVALRDSPRKETASLLSRCRELGIRCLPLSRRPVPYLQWLVAQLGLKGAVVAGEIDDGSREIAAQGSLSVGQKARRIEKLEEGGDTVAVVGSRSEEGLLYAKASVSYTASNGSAWLKHLGHLDSARPGVGSLLSVIELGRGWKGSIRDLLGFYISGKLGVLSLFFLLWGVGLAPRDPAWWLWVGGVGVGLPALLLTLSEKPHLLPATKPTKGTHYVFSPLLGAGLLVAVVAFGWGLWGAGQGWPAAKIRSGLTLTLFLGYWYLAVGLHGWRGLGAVSGRTLRLVLLLGIPILGVAAVLHPWGLAILGTSPLSPSQIWGCAAVATAPTALEMLKRRLAVQPFFQRVSGG